MADRNASPLAPAELRVRRLRLHGSAAQVAQVRAMVAGGWAQAAWPIVGDDEVLLIRRLQVAAPAAALGTQAAAAARALATLAADPFGPGAERAPALRFARRSDYVAWRLHGLLQAGTPPAAAAVAALLCEAAPALPAVWQRLRAVAGGPGLQRLWQALDAPAAAQVLATVAVATGWTAALAAARAAPAGPLAAPLAEARPDRSLPAVELLREHLGAAAWPASDPRTRLAALLAWWLHAPARLRAPDAAAAVQALAARLARAAGAMPVAVAPAFAAPDEPSGATLHEPVDRSGAASPRRAAPLLAAPGAPAAVAGERASLPDGPAASVPDASTASSEAEPLPARPEDVPDRCFVTGHGGLFWLLSLGSLPAWQRRLADRDEPQAGWREWVRLVQALGAEPDEAWWRFVARRTQLDAEHDEPDPDAVRRLRWSEREAEPLLAAARARHGDVALQAALMPRRARVVADAVQVDVHFAAADAVPEVRRAGLDLDPGWVPWLGCVLRWHFGSALAPD